MHKKKALILTFTFLMPFNQTLWAEETADTTDYGAASETLLPAVQEEPVAQTRSITVEMSDSAAMGESGVTAEESTEGTETAVITDETVSETATERARPGYTRDAMRDHWKAREEQYQALRERAEEAGVMLPEHPPWRSEMSQLIGPSMEERMAHRKEMMSKSQEERDAYRQQRYQEMRARADARQQALDEEWAKHQEVIQGMSDEEREACHAMHRHHMGMMRGGGAGPGCGAMGHQGCAMHQGDYRPRMMPGYGPGYGYGAGPYAPRNFWDPNQ